ncbi:hypothetical protein MMC24_005777 [Lignoscripta atroalba]|nr:hypothetical protein [Lignoscripta atroalba]
MSASSIWSTPPANYRELSQQYQRQHAEAIAAGDYVPFVWPYRSFGPFLLILYLLLPPTKSLLVHYARYPVFASVVYLSVATVRESRAAVLGSYGVGLLDAWAILWAATLIIFHDARTEFKRIEKVEGKESKKGNEGGSSSSRDGNIHNSGADAQPLRARQMNGSLSRGISDDSLPQGSNDASSNGPPAYIWQSLPSPLLTRLNWTADLVSNFRGTGWNFQISSIPSPPSAIIHELQKTPPPSPAPPLTSQPISPTGNIRYPTPRSLLLHKLTTLLLGYLALDTLKVLMMADPYFWGLVTAPPPSYLPSPTLTRIYRLLLSLAGVYTPLQTLFATGPLLFVGLLGPTHLGLRAAAWQYPDTYGSYSMVFRKGLAGWWGGWWHQTFRFAFEAPAQWIEAKLGWEKRSLRGKVLGLLVAFGCSGCLHATGSFTQLGTTQPLLGPFRFFALQPLGIAVQMVGAACLKRVGVRDKLHPWVRGCGNFVLVHVWFYYTAPFLVDDFARGGLWLFEPVPVSLWRGLGWGLEGEGWWCWHGPFVTWWWGERWWQSGLAL